MRILSALALLISANAFACPDLSGTFSCKNQNGTTEAVTISQANKDGVTTYTYNNQAIPADNTAYKIEDSQNLRDGTFRAWCDEKDTNVLNTEILGKYYANGAPFGDLTMDMAFSLAGTDLHQVITGKVVEANGTEHPLNAEMTCTRSN